MGLYYKVYPWEALPQSPCPSFPYRALQAQDRKGRLLGSSIWWFHWGCCGIWGSFGDGFCTGQQFLIWPVGTSSRRPFLIFSTVCYSSPLYSLVSIEYRLFVQNESIFPALFFQLSFFRLRWVQNALEDARWGSLRETRSERILGRSYINLCCCWNGYEEAPYQSII